MKAINSKSLVIDASIARAAGRKDHPVSKACRDLLEAVLKICHRVVITREIAAEWARHQSYFTVQWRSSMNARKKVALPETVQNDLLRIGISNSSLTQRERDALLKDVHLIEAALKADFAVVSLDETARTLFREIAHEAGLLKPVVWVNPVRKEESAIEWLKGGAKDEKKRRLAFEEPD